MFIDSYRRLWSETGEPLQLRAVGWILLLLSLALPLCLGLLPYAPIIPLITLAVLAAVVGLVVFFNVQSFAVFIIPSLFFLGASYYYKAIMPLFFIAFFAWHMRRSKLTFDIPFPLPLLIIVIIGLYSFTKAVDPNLGRYALFYTLIIPIFIMLAFYGLDLSTREIRISLMIFCSVASILGWAGFITWLFTGAYRVMYTWGVGAQNRGAAFLGLFLPYALVSLIDAFRYRKNRLIWLTIFVGLLGGILASQTRAIMLTLIPVVFYISRHDKYALRILLIALLISLATIPSLLVTRMAFFFGQGEVDWSSVGRIQIWLNSFEMLPKYFWTGMGIGSFKQIYSVTFPYAFIQADHPHNIYLQFMFDYGIFGLVGHLWLFFSGLWISHKAMKQGLTTKLHDEARAILGLNAGLICILIAGLTDSFLTALRVAFAFWIVFAYLLVLSRRIRSSLVSG